MVDAVASKHGIFLNAAKTEMMVVGRLMTLPTLSRSLSPTLSLSGEELLAAGSFRYLGYCFAEDGSMSVEKYHALAALCQFKRYMGQPQAEQYAKNGSVYHIHFAHLRKMEVCITLSFCPFSRTAAKRGHGRRFGWVD
eukprot:357353-Chlamydomonas_euryale.AAC.2